MPITRRKYHAMTIPRSHIIIEPYLKYLDQGHIGTNQGGNYIFMYRTHSGTNLLHIGGSSYHQSRGNWCDALFMSASRMG